MLFRQKKQFPFLWNKGQRGNKINEKVNAPHVVLSRVAVQAQSADLSPKFPLAPLLHMPYDNLRVIK
jgi:hypothetical protein